MKSILTAVLAIFLFQSCVIEESYVFDKDMKGSYRMNFDYSGFVDGKDEDSSDEFVKGIEHSMDSIYQVMKNVDGLSNVSMDTEGMSTSMSYDFDGVETLNEVESLDEDTPADYKAITMSKKGFTFQPNMGELAEKGGGKEMNDMMDKMLDWKITVKFDHDVKAGKMKGFNEIAPNTFQYHSKTDGLDISPKLGIKN